MATGTGALSLALESQAWGYQYMAFRLAQVLREHGRDCTVIRVPHTAPSLEQAIHVALDGASDRSLQVLSELGRLDGDIDAARSNWASPTMSEVLADMFNGMPATVSVGTDERRASARLEQEVDFGGGLRLRDLSATGACLIIEGSAPALGATFRCAAADIGELCGTVRWVHDLADGKSVFGLQMETSDAHHYGIRHRSFAIRVGRADVSAARRQLEPSAARGRQPTTRHLVFQHTARRAPIETSSRDNGARPDSPSWAHRRAISAADAMAGTQNS